MPDVEDEKIIESIQNAICDVTSKGRSNSPRAVLIVWTCLGVCGGWGTNTERIITFN